jgi:hypothetical protein
LNSGLYSAHKIVVAGQARPFAIGIKPFVNDNRISTRKNWGTLVYGMRERYVVKGWLSATHDLIQFFAGEFVGRLRLFLGVLGILEVLLVHEIFGVLLV